MATLCVSFYEPLARGVRTAARARAIDLGGQSLKLSTKAAVFKRSTLLIGRAKHSKDPVIAAVIRYTQEGWPESDATTNCDLKYSVADFRRIHTLLSCQNGCLFYSSRIVIPQGLHDQILQLLHLGHFGIQRMKQLARTVVYRPRIDDDIANTCRNCTACAEHQNNSPKTANHPWIMPEKPWSRIHIDHAINFMGKNWLIMVDAYSEYPCIRPTTSVDTKATTDLLEEEFAHFGFPLAIVSDNATTFKSDEFQEWCASRGIIHLTGAPYYPATNGAAERLVQTFKQALRKSEMSPRQALSEFLMQYRRTPLPSGYSSSELLNGCRIRTRLA